MIKDGYISIYGVTTEDYVEGDPLPCPKCGMTSAEVVRALEFEPQGFRLGCTHCGYVVPEEYMVYNHNSEEGIKDALDIWNRLSMMAFLEEDMKQSRNLIKEFNELHPELMDYPDEDESEELGEDSK